MRIKQLLFVAVAGLLSGLLLNFVFKAIENVSGEKVYTLLLNVDYIPILKEYTFPEWIEVTFHLIVSVILSVCLYLFLHLIKVRVKRMQIIWSVAICGIIGLALYPTTALSVRTPPLTSIAALLYWIGGHILFGYILGWMLARVSRLSKT